MVPWYHFHLFYCPSLLLFRFEGSHSLSDEGEGKRPCSSHMERQPWCIAQQTCVLTDLLLHISATGWRQWNFGFWGSIEGSLESDVRRLFFFNSNFLVARSDSRHTKFNERALELRNCRERRLVSRERAGVSRPFSSLRDRRGFPSSSTRFARSLAHFFAPC